MGFFGKLKQNLNHGGIKISLVTPERVGKDDPTVTVQATITATATPRLIKSVTADFVTHYFSNNSNSTPQEAVLSNQVYNTPFQLAAGQSLNLSFTLNMNPGQDHPMLSALDKAAGILSKLSNQNQQFVHNIRVRADVEGIANDPEHSQRIIWEGHEQSMVQFTIT